MVNGSISSIFSSYESELALIFLVLCNLLIILYNILVALFTNAFGLIGSINIIESIAFLRIDQILILISLLISPYLLIFLLNSISDSNSEIFSLHIEQ